jgi:hypothetical protein
MTTKTIQKGTAKPSKDNKKLEAIKDTESESKRYTKVSLSAASMSAILSDDFTKLMFPDIKLNDSIDLLDEKITSIKSGDMSQIEAMLIGQAQALQTMFVTLGRMATKKTQLAQYTAFMNMALKAQSQSRATIQALTELKYPKQATFVKQANIAGGNQQVNNTINSEEASRVNEIENQPNELLEVNNGSKKMDISSTATSSGTDKEMETLAT